MRKIPTLFVRDPDNMRYVLPEVHPDCGWVLAGEGIATRKYDGTCVMLDDAGVWWARREVKPGKTAPVGWLEVDYDPVTEKRVGWEPAENSGWARWLQDALDHDQHSRPLTQGTYELCGPKVNGNPEGYEHHVIVWHAGAQAMHEQGIARGWANAAEAYADLANIVPRLGVEGIVWHHADGRMAKLKRRDFA